MPSSPHTLNALMRSRARVRKWHASLTYHGEAAVDALKESLMKSYNRSFAWTGSVEPCTGVLCETCQRCLRDIVILKVSEGTHHATASSMLAAVEIGCRVCTCLWRYLAGFRNIDPENVPKEMNQDRLEEFSIFGTISKDATIFKVLTSDFQEWYLVPSAIRNEIVPRIELFSYHNDRNNLMNHYWELANGWLSNCSSYHTKCKHLMSVENYYPTRLIDVRANSSDGELRLYSTSDGAIKKPYMTLSHCWGTSQFLHLTTSTLNRLQKGFNLAELPPTFQDAVMVTRALGINFLWIDALCIIQDSNVDWQHEASLMSQVYLNSICNISALDAHDSTGGLFFNRHTSNIPYCTLKICRKFRRERLYDFAYTDFWSDSVQHAPLTRRAWVLQERLLAPRVLHFGKRQLLWECNESRACEVYPRGMRIPNPRPSFRSTSDKFLKESFTTILQGGLENALTSSQMHGAWNDLVQYYTRCNLTMSKDKLVAISGIVKRLQPLFKTDYLAGLWKDNLLQQLLWHVDFYNEVRRDLAGEERPEYRAPSWSWASIDAPIRTGWHLHREQDHMATIIEARVTPVTDDITGQIAKGYIRLRAPLFPVKVETSGHTRYLDLVWDWGQLGSIVTIVPDVWPESAVEGLQFVPLSRMSAHPDSTALLIYGLILQPVEERQGEYQRWGHVRINGEWKLEREFLKFGLKLINVEWIYNPPEKYPEQTITLI